MLLFPNRKDTKMEIDFLLSVIVAENPATLVANAMGRKRKKCE